jgi:hypothetical protein
MADSGAGEPAAPGSFGKRLIFWDFPRASSIVLMSSARGVNRVFIATDLLADTPEPQRPARVERLIRERTGKTWHVVRVEPIRDEAEQEIKGFIAYTSR